MEKNEPNELHLLLLSEVSPNSLATTAWLKQEGHVADPFPTQPATARPARLLSPNPERTSSKSESGAVSPGAVRGPPSALVRALRRVQALTLLEVLRAIVATTDSADARRDRENHQRRPRSAGEGGEG